jgi:hypothetical protein
LGERRLFTVYGACSFILQETPEIEVRAPEGQNGCETANNVQRDIYDCNYEYFVLESLLLCLIRRPGYCSINNYPDLQEDQQIQIENYRPLSALNDFFTLLGALVALKFFTQRLIQCALLMF